MKIGITFNVKSAKPASAAAADAAAADSEEEFDSPETVEAVAAALRNLGHEVELLGEGEALMRRLLDGPRPDLAFNFAEGRGIGRCREARTPAILEALGVPYTGSDPLTLAVTLDKDCAKRLVAEAGGATPHWVLVDDDPEAMSELLLNLPLPVIVKPAFEGSSKGILAANLVNDHEQVLAAVKQLYGAYRQPVLVEEFIDGAELTVGLVGNRPPDVLGVMRVVPNDAGPFIYSLEVKRDWRRRVRYECPAKLSPMDMQAVHSAALLAWRALGCQDLARVDFRLRAGIPYFLEVNPLPGLSPDSGDIVLLSEAMGVEYEDLIARILGAALERLGK